MNDTPLAQNKRRYLALLLLCANAATGWVFGAEVADHYRWLEDSNSPPVKTWAAAQDKKTQEYLSKVKGQEKLETRLRQLYFVNSVSLPIQAGPRLFYKRILSDREQPIFYWQNPDHPGSEHRWLDPQAFEPKDHVSVGEWIPSPDGNAVAYTTHPEGADQATLHVSSPWAIKRLAARTEHSSRGQLSM